MSYAMSLGPDRPRPAALVAMSGFMPRVEGWPLDPTRLRDVPVAITHGSLDPVIPARFAAEAEEMLAGAGAKVLQLATPVPHMNSSFASSVAPVSAPKETSRTTGVPPTRSRRVG